jgi:hypothetical protein
MTRAHPAVSRSRVVSFLAVLRGRSHSGLYLLTGAFGGLVGAGLAIVAAEIVLSALGTKDDSFTSVLATGVLFGVFASTLSVTLLAGIRFYHRQSMRWAVSLAVAVSNLFAGALAGALCQLISNFFTESPGAGNPITATPIVFVVASILVSALLGATLSRCVPNLQPLRGLNAGLIAGVASGLSTAGLRVLDFAAPICHLAGLAVLGAALGAAMAFVERRFRDAMIEIEWEPDQRTRVGLGDKPITIGGGRDHILIPGASTHVSSVAVRNGQIEHIEMSNGKRTPLKDGSRLRVGGLVMVVHANQLPLN